MRQGRIPAQGVECLTGDHTLSSTNCITQAQSIHPDSESQQLPWHNYCCHLPLQPTFFTIPVEHKPRALTIVEIIKRLSTAYFNPQKQLPALQNHLDTGNQVKSARREAAITLLQVMAYYVDDATGRIGRRLQDGTWRDLTIKKLAAYAKIRFKRAKRAMHDIMKAGYIKVTRQWMRDDKGRYKGLPSVRTFLPKLFIDLDVKGELWTKWFWNMEYKKEQEFKKQTKAQKRKARATLGLINQTLKNGMKKVSDGFKTLVKGIPSTAPKGRGEAIKKLYGDLIHKGFTPKEAFEYIEKNPPPLIA
jgi:hypothetical protein